MPPAEEARTSAGARDSVVFTGFEPALAAIDVGLAVVSGAMVTSFFAAVGWAWPWVVVATVGLAALAFGRRYRLTIDADGITLQAIRAWVLPIARHHWWLDARIDLYESWEATDPEGLCVAPLYFATTERESECFAAGPPARSRTLHAAMSAAVDRFRAAAPRGPLELRHRVLGPQAAAFDFPHATRNARGRLRELQSVAPVTLGPSVTIPPGSRFSFLAADFVDPRRDDRLYAVEVASEIPVHGLTVAAGAIVAFADDGAGPALWVERAQPGEVSLGGHPVRGDAQIVVDERGALAAFTLARDVRLGGFAIAGGSALSRERPILPSLPVTWRCALSAPLALPQLTLAPGDACFFSEDLSGLVQIHPRADVVLPEGRIRGDIAPIPAQPDGRIDVRACRDRFEKPRA